jgi:hypothetical protein
MSFGAKHLVRSSGSRTSGGLIWNCGCVTGRRMCPEALRLWRSMVALCGRPLALADDASRYHAACRALDGHYRCQEALPRRRFLIHRS